MIIDITKTVLTPGNFGKDCSGYGACCDECDYLLYCTSETQICDECDDFDCPRKVNRN